MSGYNLARKVFFLTGGAEGIGKAFVGGLLSKQARVFFVDIQEEKARATRDELGARFGSDNVAYAICNIRDRSQYEESFQQAVAKFGQVDVMVNNAGIVNEKRPKDVIETNLLGTIYGTEIATAHMRKDEGGKGGRIVNVSALAGIIHAPAAPVYVSSKHAVRAYTTSLSLNPLVGAMGVEYGLFHPDGVLTPMFQNLKAEQINFYDEFKKQYDGVQNMVKMDDMLAGFLELVSLEKMNGALMLVSKEKKSYMAVESRDIGSTYPPPSQ